MLAFGIIMLFVAAVFAVVGFLIFRGKTELIHSYHRENVTDMSGYGRAMGKSVIGIGASAALSGATALIGGTDVAVIAAIGVFVVGFTVCLILIARAQKKYNGSF